MEIDAKQKFDVHIELTEDEFVELDHTLSYLLTALTGTKDVNKEALFKEMDPLWDFKSRLVLACNNAAN